MQSTKGHCACSRRRGGTDTPDFGDAVDLAAMSLFECLPLQIHHGEDLAQDGIELALTRKGLDKRANMSSALEGLRFEAVKDLLVSTSQNHADVQTCVTIIAVRFVVANIFILLLLNQYTALQSLMPLCTADMVVAMS